MSTETMKSRPSSACASPDPPGVESTGFPAMVTIARICPSPGVSISSRSTATGSSPPNSGAPRTRLRHTSWWPGPTRPRSTTSIAGSGSSTPPSRSKFPVSRFSSWIAHWATEPNPCVDTPIRPYAAAESAAAKSRVSCRIVSAPTPLACSARSGVKGATRSRTSSTWSTYAGGEVSPSSNSTCSIASSTAASEPGRTKWCSVATFAVSVRRGSSTTIRPPRALRSRSRCGKSGAVISEPLEAMGLAPRTRKKSVRSRSGIGSSSWWP